MSYPRDLVGKAIEFDWPKANNVVSGQQLVVTGSQVGISLSVPVYSFSQARIGDGSTPPVPARFVNLNAPWNVLFLVYVPGEVTSVRLAIKSVLTGPMSGCYLFRYMLDTKRVAHVGTDQGGPQSAGSRRAKNNWKQYLQTPQFNFSQVMGANPAAYFTDEEMKNSPVQGRFTVPRIFGAFDQNGDAFAIRTIDFSIVQTKNTFMRYVADVKPMNLLNWSLIRNLQQFQS